MVNPVRRSSPVKNGFHLDKLHSHFHSNRTFSENVLRSVLRLGFQVHFSKCTSVFGKSLDSLVPFYYQEEQ